MKGKQPPRNHVAGKLKVAPSWLFGVVWTGDSNSAALQTEGGRYPPIRAKLSKSWPHDGRNPEFAAWFSCLEAGGKMESRHDLQANQPEEGPGWAGGPLEGTGTFVVFEGEPKRKLTCFRSPLLCML